jgi:hypothetical protein
MAGIAVAASLAKDALPAAIQANDSGLMDALQGMMLQDGQAAPQSAQQ